MASLRRDLLNFKKSSLKLWIQRGLVAWLVMIAVWYFSVFARVVAYIWYDPSSTAFMNEQLAELQLENAHIQKRQEWVKYPQISNNLKRALIASEDAKFLDHDGFDWDGIEIALEKNIKKGRVVAGGSTISQQLAKNLFLNAARTPWRKLDEAVITLMIEAILDKQRIYELYLNVIEWGKGIYGIQAAAKYYFGTSAQKLTSYQSAFLAAMVPNPRYYQTHRNSSHLRQKTSIIMRRMRAADIP